MVLGVVPFGLVIGVTIGHMRLGGALGLSSAALYFGGSGHLAALTLLPDGAGPLAVLATVAVVNCRLALYAAALAPRFADQPAWFRWLAPQVLVDQTYAITTARPDLHGAALRRYWITAGGAFALAGWRATPRPAARAGAASALAAGHRGSRDVRRAARTAVGAPTAAVAAGVGGVVAAAASVLPQASAARRALAGLLAATLVDREAEHGTEENDTRTIRTGPS